MDKSKKKKKKKLPRYKRMIRLWCWRINKFLKLNNKVNALNEWAAANPKIFFGCSLGIMALVVITSFISLGATYYYRDNHQQVQEQSQNSQKEQEEVLGTPEVFQNINHLRSIDATKKQINTDTRELVMKGKALSNEVDSLMSLPEKTHEDSVRIVQDYNAVQSIVEFLDKQDKK